MTPREGTLFADRYRLVRKVGGGHVASVWKAFDHETQSFAAIKVLSSAMHSHAEALTRFSLEERICSELVGGYFAERTDNGTYQGRRYVVWRWHEGESLRTLFERTHQLDAATVQSIVEETATALKIAHKAGIFHGDVKPENIHFANAKPGQARQLKLLGFGIASRAPRGGKFVRGRQRPGVIVGSPLYMSPDCIMGYLPQDARDDLWALGVITYEALVGRPPFVGPDETTVFQSILRREAPLPSALTKLPSSVDSFWQQVLAGDFLTAEDFSVALHEALRPAIRSSHTQRSARGFTVPTPFAPAEASVPGDSGTGASSSERSLSSAPEQVPTATPRSSHEPAAPLRTKPRKTASGLPAANPPPAPFLPVSVEPAGFPMDTRKTLVGLTPFFVTPGGKPETQGAAPTSTGRSPTDTSEAESVANQPRASAPAAFAPASVQPMAHVSVSSSATMPFPRPELVRPTATVSVGGASGDTPQPADAPPPSSVASPPGERTTTQQVRRGDTETISPQPLPKQAENDATPSSEQPRTPTVVLERPAWLQSTGWGQLAQSDAVQALLGSKERRAQLVAAGIICGSAALFMAIVAFSTQSPDQELEHTSLAVQASPKPDAPQTEVRGPADSVRDEAPSGEPGVSEPHSAQPSPPEAGRRELAAWSGESEAPAIAFAPPAEETPPAALSQLPPTAETPQAAPTMNQPPKPASKPALPAPVAPIPPPAPQPATGATRQPTRLPLPAPGARTQPTPAPEPPTRASPPPRGRTAPSRQIDPGEFDFGI